MTLRLFSANSLATRSLGGFLGLAVVVAAAAPVPAATGSVTEPRPALSNPVSRTLQQVLGINAIASWIGGRILARELAEEVDGNLSVKIKTFSGFDLLAGKARQISIHGKELVYDDTLPITEVRVWTRQETPIFVSGKRKPALMMPVEARLKAVIDEDEVNRYFRGEKGRAALTNVKVDLPPFGPQHVDILEPHVDITSQGLKLTGLVNVHGAPVANALGVEIAGKLQLNDDGDKLQLADLKVDLEGVEDTTAMTGFIQEYFAKVADFSKIKVKRHQVAVRMDAPKSDSDRLVVTGSVVIAPKKSLE
jgi:hypothetical protein